ncbi:hypothetical protein ACLOJK_002326 [Asimina triloba]
MGEEIHDPSGLSTTPICGPKQTRPRRSPARLPVTATDSSGLRPSREQAHRASPEVWPREGPSERLASGGLEMPLVRHVARYYTSNFEVV